MVKFIKSDHLNRRPHLDLNNIELLGGHNSGSRKGKSTIVNAEDIAGKQMSVGLF